MNSSIFYRILIAVIFCVLLFLLLPPVISLIGLSLPGELLTVIKICVGALALFYIITGRPAIV